MKQLFIWGQGFYGYKKVKGVPRIGNALIKDSIDTYAGNWTSYIHGYHPFPPQGEYKFPDELYLEVSGYASVQFDYLEVGHNVKIFSNDLLHFFQENGLTEGYEIAKIKSVMNASGKVLETKPYYALRFYEFDNNLLEYPSEGAVYGKGAKGNKIYPNMTPKSNVDKKIFVLDIEISVIYYQTLIFTQEIRDEIIKRKFIGPKIYSTQEYIQAYNG
ncbi:hypothetical protein CKY20_10890 [Capnocytophaga canis]|uniref:Immunity protein 43 domain-containing protein n=1 Tax=Capnocytophaga canis TaxID=1848903 RepID=A0A3A1YGY0_9FLAO|nr:Imm43 family immunity protein [Capnocytophaga canis]RIY35297.1 hypothetical protein CKY20_10890 [Capnocytophaga canis]